MTNIILSIIFQVKPDTAMNLMSVIIFAIMLFFVYVAYKLLKFVILSDMLFKQNKEMIRLLRKIAGEPEIKEELEDHENQNDDTPEKPTEWL